MKHKFNKKKKTYTLKRGEYLYIPSNLKTSLGVYEISSPRSLGYIYIEINHKIEKVGCGIPIKILAIRKIEGVVFNMEYDLFIDTTEDEVRFDID
jgi:hypothetical protein